MTPERMMALVVSLTIGYLVPTEQLLQLTLFTDKLSETVNWPIGPVGPVSPVGPIGPDRPVGPCMVAIVYDVMDVWFTSNDRNNTPKCGDGSPSSTGGFLYPETVSLTRDLTRDPVATLHAGVLTIFVHAVCTQVC